MPIPTAEAINTTARILEAFTALLHGDNMPIFKAHATMVEGTQAVIQVTSTAPSTAASHPYPFSAHGEVAVASSID